jgi:predicted metalloprotease with PDZ domain
VCSSARRQCAVTGSVVRHVHTCDRGAVHACRCGHAHGRRARMHAGVGMRMGDVVIGGGRAVVATMSGSAAEAAGLHIGDVVLSVDGIPAAALDAPALRRHMRGPVGSSVDLVVHRADAVRPPHMHADLDVHHADAVRPPLPAHMHAQAARAAA